MKTALLVIDVQQVLCSGEYAAFDIEPVIERINAVTAKARAAGAPVVFIQHEDDGPMRFGSDRWQLDSRLAARPEDTRLRKTTPDSFFKTELRNLLQSWGVDELVVCGLQSDFCVDSTVRAALAHGYPVVLVSDAHSTLDNGVLSAAQISAHHNVTLGNVDSFGPRARTIPAAAVHIAA